MVKIYSYDENEASIVMELGSNEGIKLASSILSKINEDLYVDWEYVLEEINEKVEDGIARKKIHISVIPRKDKDSIVIVSLQQADVLAIIPS
ncbi:hypothetical protein [Persephonella sp.]